MSAYVIIANGDFLSKHLIQTLCRNKIIIVLDGAAKKLRALDIKPDIILGDFDSLDTETQQFYGITKTFNEIDLHSSSYVGNNEILIIPSKDQSKTDLVKAIHYCDKQHASDITLLCALGGRVDHDEGNKRALRLEYNPSRPMMLYTETHLLRYIKNATIEIIGNIGDTVGILSYPSALFSSSGLTYDGNQSAFHFGYDSICNSLKNKMATITIDGEALLMLPQSETSHVIG
jgi:thiamine pyrophosphokinase